jgi:hypothetical protein
VTIFNVLSPPPAKGQAIKNGQRPETTGCRYIRGISKVLPNIFGKGKRAKFPFLLVIPFCWPRQPQNCWGPHNAGGGRSLTKAGPT